MGVSYHLKYYTGESNIYPGFNYIHMSVALVNHIKAHDRESFEKILELFKTRAGLVDKFPGFKEFKLFASPETLEIMVMTIWESREDFQRWLKSKEFKEGHKRVKPSGIKADSRGVAYDIVQ